MKEQIEELVSENIAIAGKIAGKYLSDGYEYDDLFQIASIGLYNAARTFNKSRGYKFSTYAYMCVSNELKKFFQMQKYKLRAGDKSVLHLEEVIGETDGVTFLETIGTENSFEDEAIDSILVNELMQKLNQKERNVVKMRFFLNMKFREIAEVYECSDSHIQQVLKKALEKMRMYGKNLEVVA